MAHRLRRYSRRQEGGGYHMSSESRRDIAGHRRVKARMEGRNMEGGLCVKVRWVGVRQ